jgi:hypothetical protein
MRAAKINNTFVFNKIANILTKVDQFRRKIVAITPPDDMQAGKIRVVGFK